MATRHSSAFGFLSVLLARCIAVLQAVATVWQRRRLVGRLGALDDHMLADLGITRQDVLSVLAEPMFRDPSLRLAERARETRHGNRAAARENRALGRPEAEAQRGSVPPACDLEPRRAA